jgi:hypothetical protein
MKRAFAMLAQRIRCEWNLLARIAFPLSAPYLAVTAAFLFVIV